MRILLLTHSFNSLCQRIFVELLERGEDVSVEFDINDAVTAEAVRLFEPQLLIAPYLKRAIPPSVWQKVPCIVIHPGIKGDRGPSALDWAILHGESEWGVTLFQANAEMDAGDIWATREFPMREAGKSSIYRNEVTEASVACVLEVLAKIRSSDFHPEPFDVHGRARWRPQMKQRDRAIDWERDTTARVLRKMRCADGDPGVLDRLCGMPVYIYNACQEEDLRGRPGEILAVRDSAICRATADGAVWIGHLRPKGNTDTPFKLPAVTLLKEQLRGIPEVSADGETTCREIWYEEIGEIGYVHFPFYNGAMSTGQCRRLWETVKFAKTRPTGAIALMGGADFWSNGIHLNTIEAAASPAEESALNIEAMNKVCEEIILTTSHATISAMSGNAGAGGVFLALSADYVFARSGVVLSPHYKNMGNLYGSEYWTFSLPRRIGGDRAKALMADRLPLSARRARELGLVDDCFGDSVASFRGLLRERILDIVRTSDLGKKAERRARDEAQKPLDTYRAEELERMNLNFFGFDPSYHIARYNFVHRIPKSHTPLYLARHRRRAKPS